MEVQYKDLLYAVGSGENINITGRPGKSVGLMGPASVGYSTHRPIGMRRPSKYSSIARAMDHICLDKDTNVLESHDSIYGQTTIDGTVYRYQCDGATVIFENDRLHGPAKLIPILLYYLRSASEHTEFKEAAQRIIDDVSACGIATSADVLLLCDSFWYDIAKDAAPVNFETEALALSTVQKGIDTGMLTQMPVLSKLGVLPPLTNLAADTKKSETKRKTNAKKNVFADILSGKYIIPYAWSAEQQKKIPALSTLEDYVPNKEFYYLISKISYRFQKIILRLNGGCVGADAIQKDYINSFVLGRPGTGKTKTLYAVAAALGMPVYTIALSKNTEEDTFQGMNKIIEGKLSFVRTDFLDAITSGGIILLEEINLADPGVVMGAIGQAVEFPFSIMADGYKPEKRHPLTAVFGLFNIGTYGSKNISQALSNRFKQAYILDDVKKEDFINILRKQVESTTGSVDESAYKFAMPVPRELTTLDIDKVYDAYNRIVSYMKSPKVNAEDEILNLSIRTCTGTLECMAEGEPFKEAVYHTLIGKIAENDLDLANAVFTNVIGTMPD